MSKRILQLTASNVLRLEAVSITPGTGAVVISGKNGAGKTSVLSSIVSVLAGGKNRPENLLREGKERGEIVIHIGDTNPELIAKLTVTESGETLVVTTADGAVYKSPQAILDGLRGAIGFSPMEFLSIDPKAQAEMLRKLVGLDFSGLEIKRKQLFDSRTLVNREVEQARQMVSGTPQYEGVPEVEVSVAELSLKLQEANATNKAKDDSWVKANNAMDELESAQLANAEAQTAVEELEAKLQAAMIALEKSNRAVENAMIKSTGLRNAASAMPDADPAPILEQIKNAESVNVKVRANRTRQTWIGQLHAKEQESDDLTTKIETVDKEKRDQLEAAQMPVAGLSFTESGVTFKGQPLKQASGAEQLKVALGMGVALNPKLRVLLFKDASLLDEDSLREVEAFCEEKDVQCWLEVVGNQPGAVMIADGRTV